MKHNIISPFVIIITFLLGLFNFEEAIAQQIDSKMANHFLNTYESKAIDFLRIQTSEENISSLPQNRKLIAFTRIMVHKEVAKNISYEVKRHFSNDENIDLRQFRQITERLYRERLSSLPEKYYEELAKSLYDI